MRRFSTILFLALLVFGLHLAARNLNQLMDFAKGAGVLTNANPNAKNPAKLDLSNISRQLPGLPAEPKKPQTPASTPSVQKYINQGKAKLAATVKKRKPAPKAPKWKESSEWILQITDEETRPLPSNPFLSEADKERIADILLQQRQDNDRTVKDITAMVHVGAGQEAMGILVQQEAMLEAAAQTAPSLAKFYAQRRRILAETQQRLNASFNRRMKRQARAPKQK